MNQGQRSLIDCSKVYAKQTQDRGVGVFASQNFKKGDIVEYGIARRLQSSEESNPYLFQWSEDKKVFAFCSGCATYYNTDPADKTNT